MTRVSGKTIVLGITGGIAAYKAAELCRLLVKAGATVHVVMTKAAEQFITPLTMQTLSGHAVAHDLFDLAEEARIGHIRLADDADLIVIAPATADAIARVAAGMADDLLSAVVLASRAPVLLAPAMNVNMWSSPITQQNLGRLAALGRFRTVGPDVGELACGWVGPGRLIEPTEIAAAAERLLTPQDLAGRRVVVTAGPTFEPLDDVRFLGNRSSGKMGFAIAEAAARRGAHVTLIAGPVALATPPGAGIVRRDVETAEDLRAVLIPACANADAVVMAAAVADFRPAARVAGKLSRRSGRGTTAGGTASAATLPGPAADGDVPAALSLVANPDLLAELGRERRGGRPLLVGFAAEASRDAAALVTRAREKLTEKNCDVIVANDISAPGLGFGSDENALTLVFANGKTDTLARAPKTELADALWDRLLARFPSDRASPRAATGRRSGGAAARSTSLRADRARGRRG